MATGLTSELTTGISELDLQHEALLELIAGAAAVIESGRAAAARQAIAEIADGFYHHFASEEMLMEASDYPETRAHKTAHRLFLHYLDLNLRLEAQGGLGPRLARWLRESLTGWLSYHMRTNDVPLTRFLLHRTGRSAQTRAPRPKAFTH